VVEIRVDLYKSIGLAELRNLEYQLLTHLSFDSVYVMMPWWSDIDNTLSEQE